MHYLLFFVILSITGLSADEPVSMDLNSALQRAWCYSPVLSMANTEVGVRESVEHQERLWPNPEASIDADDDGDCSSRRGANTEVAVSLSQLIELGGKRSARQLGAAYQTELALFDLEATKLDICQEVTKAIVDVACAQELMKLADEQERISKEAFTSVSTKVEAGKVSPLQTQKAYIAHSKSRLILSKAKRALELSKKKLASFWGTSCPDFDFVSFPLENINDRIEDLCVLLEKQKNNPDVKRWNSEILMAKEVVSLEKAQRIPDVTVTGGYIYDCKKSYWLAGLSFPLPVFNWNQGNICRAKLELAKLYDAQKQAIVDLNIQLTQAYEDLMTAYNEGLAFKESILASANAAFDASKEGYLHGKQDYLELLDAQRTLFEVQEQYIYTLMDYHYKKAEVNRLVGICSTCF